jgi:hypothetical protein
MVRGSCKCGEELPLTVDYLDLVIPAKVNDHHPADHTRAKNRGFLQFFLFALHIFCLAAVFL